MPHLRDRFIQSLILKKLKFSPVVTVQGVRQCGKSTFVRDLLSLKLDSMTYKTLDQPSVLKHVQKHPETFLEEHLGTKTLAVDEAQKAPVLFDTIKFKVDQKRIPGQYLLLGSTEFSKELHIRESLTGRMSRARMFPLTLRESLSKNKSDQISRKELLTYLEKGGMPGLFAIRNSHEMDPQIEDWLNLTCRRDLLQFPKVRPDPELARELLRLLATLEDPTALNLASQSHALKRSVDFHLKLLEQLFVICPVKPVAQSTGKTRWYLCDVAIARHLGADFKRRLETAYLQNRMANISFSGEAYPTIFYFKAPKGARVDFVEIVNGEMTSATKIIDGETRDERDLASLVAFSKRDGVTSKTQLRALCFSAWPVKGKPYKCQEWQDAF